MQEAISEICDELKEFLLEKNKSYGNSAAEPLQIFSTMSPMDQINVRIDDKLSRIARGNDYRNEDTELDLIGYLILKRAILRKDENKRAEALTTKVAQAKGGKDENS